MDWWAAGLWGLFGGLAIELIDLYKLVRTDDGQYAWPVGDDGFWPAYGVAVAIRLVVGFGTACVVWQSNGLDDAATAMGLGAGSIGFVEHLTRGARPAALPPAGDG